MLINKPIFRALNSEQKIRLLRFLLSGRSMPDMSERELAKIVKMPNVSVNRIMACFEELNLVHWRGVGHSHVWSVNEESHAYGVLKKVINAMEENRTPAESLKKALIKEIRKLPVIRAILFGSVARGDDRPGSDIDLCLIVRDQKDKKSVQEAMLGLGTKIQKAYGNFLGDYVLTESEYKRKRGLGVIKNIEKEGVRLI